MLVAILLGMGAALYLFIYKPALSTDVTEAISAVGRHYVLPEDEQPALLTVEDKSKLNTEFFRNSENGDKVLVYKNNKLVIIYRPSIDRIIQVGPVSMAEMK